MSLTLLFHPLSSYCQKVLVALYEKDTPFSAEFIDLSKAEARARLVALWPIAKFPVLRDEARGVTVPESTIIIEYLEAFYPGKTRLIPAATEQALACRLLDRFFDLHVHDQMQKIVGDKLRPEARRDPEGVQRARATLRTAYRYLEHELGDRQWALGDAFSMVDCAASPALFYASRVEPLGNDHPRLAAYFARLSERPSFARVTAEAAPYMKMFPG
jgi:glutathione S-transferase